MHAGSRLRAHVRDDLGDAGSLGTGVELPDGDIIVPTTSVRSGTVFTTGVRAFRSPHPFADVRPDGSQALAIEDGRTLVVLDGPIFDKELERITVKVGPVDDRPGHLPPQQSRFEFHSATWVPHDWEVSG